MTTSGKTGSLSLDRDDGEGHDAPTSVAQIPEALLKSLRKPEVTPPAPAPTPPAPPPPSVDEEDDSDESATAVLVDAPRARLPAPAPRPAPPRVAPAPPAPAAPPAAIERFAPVTEDSPDEDPSDTMLSTKLPDALRPSSKSRAATPVEVAAAGPMFEPPSQDMLTPRPPPAMFTPPAPATAANPPFPVAMHRPIHEPVAAPAKSRRGLWIGLVVGGCVLAASITAVVVLLVQHFAN